MEFSWLRGYVEQLDRTVLRGCAGRIAESKPAAVGVISQLRNGRSFRLFALLADGVGNDHGERLLRAYTSPRIL